VCSTNEKEKTQTKHSRIRPLLLSLSSQFEIKHTKHDSDDSFSIESTDTQDLKGAINDLLSVRFTLARALPQYHPDKAPLSEDAIIARESREYMETVCRIEVNWNGRIEEVFFSKPVSEPLFTLFTF